MKKTFYDLLGVAPGVDRHQIVAAYRRRTTGPAAALLDEQQRAFLNEAFSVLSDPKRRAAYDASLAEAAAGPALGSATYPDEIDRPPAAGRKWLILGLIALAAAVGVWQMRRTPAPKPVRVPAGSELTAQSTAEAAAADSPRIIRARPAVAELPATPVDTADSGEKSTEALFALLAPSIGLVTASSPGKITRMIGSGVVIGDASLITNCHVVDGYDTLRVKVGGQVYDARLDVADEEFDLCRLTVPGLRAPVVRIGETAAVRVGQKVVAIGAPAGLELTISEGIVSSLRPVSEGTVIQTTAPISPGSSGGGLFDTSGRLIGINTLTHRFGQNLNFAYPADWIRQMRNRSAHSSVREEATSGGGTPGTNRPKSGEDTAKTRLVGRWHCFRPDLGRHVEAEFFADSTFTITGLGGARSGRYTITATTLNLYGAGGDSIRVEEFSAGRMVLVDNRVRIACDRL